MGALRPGEHHLLDGSGVAVLPLYVGSAVGAKGRPRLRARHRHLDGHDLRHLAAPGCDDRPREPPDALLVWSTLVCCTCTAVLARGPYLISAILFIVANAASGGIAVLRRSAGSQHRGDGADRGIGVGIGISARTRGRHRAVFGTKDYALLFTLIAIAFALFSVPVSFVKERGNPRPRPIFGLSMIKESTRQTSTRCEAGTATRD